MSYAVRNAVHQRLPRFPLVESDDLAQVGNHGLFLDRLLPVPVGGDEKAKEALIAHLDALKQIPVPPIYGRAFNERLRMFDGQRLEGHTATAEMEVDQQVIVGLGSASVRETGISLLPTYGLPYLPGSALKGLTRSFAETDNGQWEGDPPTQDEIDALFGFQREDKETKETIAGAGRVIFHDAWYIPREEAPVPFEREVMTPHHPAYNIQEGRTQASDFDDPNPVQYLTATGAYLVAVTGPTEEWSAAALELTVAALEFAGVGAKTSSGFGRMSRYVPPPPPPEHPIIRELRAVSLEEIAARYDDYYNFALRVGLDYGDEVADRYVEALEELRSAAGDAMSSSADTEGAGPSPVGTLAAQLTAEVNELANPHRLAGIANQLDELDKEDRRYVLMAIRDYISSLGRSRLRAVERQGWYQPLRQQLDELP